MKQREWVFSFWRHSQLVKQAQALDTLKLQLMQEVCELSKGIVWYREPFFLYTADYIVGCHEINETLVCGRNAVLFEGRNERGRLYRRRVGNRLDTAHFIREASRTNCSDVRVWITCRSTSRTWTVISCSLKLPRNCRTGWIPPRWKTASS